MISIHTDIVKFYFYKTDDNVLNVMLCKHPMSSVKLVLG